MATSWRIKAALSDKTEIASSDSPIIGATSILAPMGPKKWTFFKKGDSNGILNAFGYPSKKYPAIQDLLDINAKCGMWACRPYKGGKFGGVFVTKNGTVPFEEGVSTKKIESFTNVTTSTFVGDADGEKTEFTVSVNRYVESSAKVYVDESLKTSNVNVVVSDNVATITFDEAPKSGKITLEYKMDVSDTIFVLYNHDMQKDNLAVKVIKSKDVDDAFSIAIYRFDEINNVWEEITSSPKVVGLKDNSKDNYGKNIFIERVFDDDAQILMSAQLVNADFDVSTFEDDTSYVKLNGGELGEECTDSDLPILYDELKDTTKYQLKFCFDSNASSSVVAKFEELRNNSQKYCRFLYCAPVLSADEIITSPDSAHFGVTSNRGLYCYVLNHGIHTDLYNGADFPCANMGIIAGKIVDMLSLGGGAPMWVNGDGDVGGQLGSSITKLINSDVTEEQLEQLDTLGLNAIVNDPTYGMMIVSQKTRQVKLTVFSYIAQSSITDTIMSRIIAEVFPSKIGKVLDGTLFTKTTLGMEQIVRTYAPWLEDWICLCDTTNNTDETRQNQILNCNIGLVYRGFAEKIILNVAVGSIGTNVQELVSK